MKFLVAGWETERDSPELVAEYKVPYLLASFLYLRNNPELLQRVAPFKRFLMLDSGAHTYQKPSKETDWDRYVWEYAKFVSMYSNLIDEYVELDIENKVGLEQVEKWREFLVRKTGRVPVVVWHKERGKEYWLYMVRKYPYVGFSGYVSLTEKPEIPEKNFAWFITRAHEHGAKVHGFGLSRLPILLKYPFDSVDSTSWKQMAVNGTRIYFRNGKIIRVRENARTRERYRKRLRLNMLEALKMQQYLEEYWEQKKRKGVVG